MSSNRFAAVLRVAWIGLIGLALSGCFADSTKPPADVPWFQDVHVRGPEEAFMAGISRRVWHYNGVFWKSLPRHHSHSYSALWSTKSGTLWAAGSNSGQGFVDYWNGQDWSTIEDSPAWGDRAIWASRSEVYVTSPTMPGILRFDISGWSLVAEGVFSGFTGVWGSSRSDVFAIGDGIAHFDGQTWTRQPIPDGLHPNAIWGSSATDVFVVGGAGAIAHWDGTEWSLQRPPDFGPGSPNSNLWGVWGSSAHDVYAVGAHGLLLHYDGTQWSALPGVTDQHLRAVSGSSAIDVTIVGDAGAALHFDGARWGPIPLLY